MNKFFGWLLIVVGVLIAGTAGLCTVSFFGPVLTGHVGANSDYLMVAIFGGVPFGFGLACVIAGWVIRKGK